jgi:hypothetical protein
VFDKQELLARWRALTGTPSPPLEVVEFGNTDFTSHGSEQHICTARGARADFTDGLQFWIKAMEATDWYNVEPHFTTRAEAALCKRITSWDFARLVDEYSCSLVPPLPGFVLDLNGWRWGLRMYGEWNDVAVIAELLDSFILFTWSTSA